MSEAVKQSAANLELLSLHPLFAAEVRGLDLRKPLANAEVEAIENAISHYAVLLFRDQPIDDDEHAQFTRNFGPIDAGLTLANAPRKQRLNNTDVIDLANMDADGNVYPPEHARNVSLIANI